METKTSPASCLLVEVGSHQLRSQVEKAFECQAHKSPTEANIIISNGWESQHEAKGPVWSSELSFKSVTLRLHNVMQVMQMLTNHPSWNFLNSCFYSLRSDVVLILVMFFFVRFPNEYNSLYFSRKSGPTIWGLFSLYLVTHRFAFGHLINHSLTCQNLTIPPPYKLTVKSRTTKKVRKLHYFNFFDLKYLLGGFRALFHQVFFSLRFKFYHYLHRKWHCN